MFWCYIALTTVVVSTLVLGEDERKPMYKYRYETDEFMKTAASSVPVHGYHVVEGGYYPDGAGRFAQPYGGFVGGYNGYPSGDYSFGQSPVGYSGGYNGGYSAPYTVPYYPSYYPAHGAGGEYFDRSAFGGGKKQLNDESFEKATGTHHAEGSQGKEGYAQGKVALRNNKGDSGYSNEEQAGKKVYEDGKNYHGGHHYQQEGKNADEKKSRSGHKKGHVVKGFKTSHHKDESGKTEEYFDEANDEGGNYNYDGKSGAFNENTGAAFKGGHANDRYNSEKSKKEGHFDNLHVVDNSNADKGQYDQKKYYGNGQSFGVNNGIDQQSLLGHQENSRFYKHHPYHVPFYHQK